MPSTWIEAADLLARFLPGGSIIVAIFVARNQLRSGRRATALTIAKSHYREFLYTCIRNSDIAHRGATPEGLAELRRELENYRRYRWLFTQAMFALQEIYFAYPKDNYWRRAIIVLASAFKAFILSESDLPSRQRGCFQPEFLNVLMTELKDFQHPILTSGVPLADRGNELHS